MLIIRQDYLEKAADVDFLERIEPMLRANMPEGMARGLDLWAVGEHCLEVARSHGLTTERAIAAFALHMVSIHPEFHRQPRINAILHDTTISERERMSRIVDDATESDWEEAAKGAEQAAAKYWKPFRARLNAAAIR